MTSSTQRLRIGFIGAGGNTRARHLPGFQSIPGVECRAVANRTLESARRVAADFHIPSACADWREIIESPEIEAVCIGTWPDRHAEIAIAALQAGKHVLCEARMAASLSEAERMLAAAQAHPDRTAQLVPAPFSLTVDETVRAWLSAGRLGHLREITVIHTHGGAARASLPATWRQLTAHSGHNILSMGIHYEIVNRWLGGEASWVLADGAIYESQRPSTRSPDLQTVDIPDSIAILGRWSDGVRLVCHFSGVASGLPVQEIRLHGSEGSLRFDARADQLFSAAAGERAETEIVIPPERRGAWRVEADFVRSIREGTPVTLTSFEDGLRYMRFTDAVWKSWHRQGLKTPCG